jgi:hypothetical protein
MNGGIELYRDIKRKTFSDAAEMWKKHAKHQVNTVDEFNMSTKAVVKALLEVCVGYYRAIDGDPKDLTKYLMMIWRKDEAREKLENEEKESNIRHLCLARRRD